MTNLKKVQIYIPCNAGTEDGTGDSTEDGTGLMFSLLNSALVFSIIGTSDTSVKCKQKFITKSKNCVNQ